MVSNFIDSKLSVLAKQQLLDYRNNQPGTCFSDVNFELDLESAYHIQDEVTKLRVQSGETVIGYKVGCTGPGTTKQFGMKGPVRGTLFAEEVKNTGENINLSDFTNLAIEGEMAIQIGENNRIKSCFPVVELHNFVFRRKKKTLTELIANNAINAGVVLPSFKLQNPNNLHEVSGILAIEINGQKVGESTLWPIQGKPEGSLDWLEHHLKKFQLAVTPGNIILAGTNLGLYPVKKGDSINVLVNGEKNVSCFIRGS